ncbi:MAG: hypothetical protein PVJ19_20210 [Desulfobacteraceae bacterium]
MNKFCGLILLIALLIPLNCDAKDTTTINGETVQKLMQHYFSADAKVGDDRLPYYGTGDFNADGINDVAVLFYPQQNMKQSKQVRPSWPWAFEGSMQSDKHYKSLAIINGHPDGWMSPNTQVFALFDKSGTLETPSFQLIVKKRSENDYAQHLKGLPVPTAGDLIILPTEAGIDTYIFWNKSTYKLHIPEEVP